MTATLLVGLALVVGAACGSSSKGSPAGPSGNSPTTATQSNSGGGY